MPGHRISRSALKYPAPFVFDKYQCSYCSLLLKNAVQPKCGHWMCETCAEQLFSSSTPKCPLPSCKESFSAEAGDEYLPDRRVRKEIEVMIVRCTYYQKGCKWEDRLAKLEDHLKSCEYTTPEDMEDIDMSECPLAGLGCSSADKMTKEELNHHAVEKGVEHLDASADIARDSPQLVKAKKVGSSARQVFHDSTNSQAMPAPQETIPAPFPHQESGEISQGGHMIYSASQFNPSILRQVRLVVMPQQMAELESSAASAIDQSALTGEMDLARQTADDKALLLILGGSKFLWKIPQRLTDARAGVAISFDSRPFYTSHHGYKMCLRAYLNGDGMSLFFVIMKGEFDDILEWPFKYKITFKLINQAGRRDIVNSIQPDPMSSSFQRPKSDMNIASGVSCFVSHSQLRNGEFTQDDTIFIKCKIDIRE